MKKIIIAHLYPSEMNIYGDLGNIIALRRRLEWRGFAAEVRRVEVGEPFDFSAVDVVFGGGGQDSSQLLVYADLLERGEDLRQMAEAGVPMLTVCGLYQLFGHGFTTLEGRELPGISIFAARTVGSRRRMIGNIVIDSPFGRLVGFENHSGATILDPGQLSLGTVSQGFGNDGTTKQEGARVHDVIGTYLHGPILPKNPRLTDQLLLGALRRRYGVEELEPLDDQAELAAATAAMSRPR